MSPRIDTLYSYAQKYESSASQSTSKSFNLNNFLKKIDQLDTFEKRKDYTEKNLERISSGSSRVVYWIPGKKYVFKLASNEKGIAQNHAEASITDNSKYVNLVVKSCPDGTWVIAPAVDEIKEEDFEKYLGISFDEFGKVLKYALRSLSRKKRTKPENYEELKKLEIIQHLSFIAKKYNLIPGDLARISSYGLIDKTPVLIDTGLTREIYDKYYAE